MRSNEPGHSDRGFYDQRWASAQGYIQEERVRFTVNAIPADCRTVLDVGCGKGQLSLEVRKRLGCSVVAMDLSVVPLAQLSLPKCCASVAQLPFADRSFDLVMATEILEHLPELAYGQALKEMARVAKHYVLITVPNRENLEESSAVCRSCKQYFHVWGHLRSFHPPTLRSLFGSFAPKQIAAFGESVETYNRFLLWILHGVAGAWYWEERTFCYYCQATNPPVPRFPFLARVCNALNARFWGPLFQRRAWLLGLYQRDANPAKGGRR